MKTLKLLMLLSLCIGHRIVLSQTYYPLPEQNAYWTVFDSWAADDYIYTVEGDTILNGMQYTKVYQLNDIPTIYDTVRTLHCFMRQDISGKKIYFIRHYLGETVEKLGYDFSVAVGDTVHMSAFCYEWDSDSLFVLEVIDPAFAQIIDGSFRNYYAFTSVANAGYTIRYIEGISSLGNTFPDRELYWDPFHQSFTMCMELNNVFIWPVGMDTTRCGFNFVDIDDYESNVLNLFPNPANNYINLDIPVNFTKGSFELTDLMGNQLKKISFFNSSTQIQVDLSPYPSGIYIFVTRTLTSIYYNKLIINHLNKNL